MNLKLAAGAAAAAIVLLLAMTGTSYALDTGKPYADRMAATYQVPLPPGPIRLLHPRRDPCGPGSYACVNDVDGIIYFPFPGQRMDRFGLAHELGHIFDTRVLTDQERWFLAPLLGYEHPDAAAHWNDYEWTVEPPG